MIKPFIFSGLCLSFLLGCSQEQSGSTIQSPHTGSDQLETQFGVIPPKVARPGLQVFVYSERLRARTSPEIRPDNVAGVLELNDRVEIIDPKRISAAAGAAEFIAIRVIESVTATPKGVVLFTSAKHLSTTPRKLEGDAARAANVFVIVNIATEKLRAYRRCAPAENCINRLIFEQDVVNGEDEDGTRTHVGHYRVVDWQKFYETPGKYPAWYKQGYPDMPAPGKRSDWFESRFMPNGVGLMRGAFGWYTMRVGPNPSGQWLHGTGGWGKDKKDFILFKDTFFGGLLDLFSSIRSQGCTRIDNESIAYIRQLIPVGATYIKVYAKEATRGGDASSSSQANQFNQLSSHHGDDDVRVAQYQDSAKSKSAQPERWHYILTKNGGGITNNHQLADRATVLSAGTPPDQWLEEGSLELDQTPNPITFDPAWQKHQGGDLYGLGERAFSGLFLVDEGTLLNYQHPKQLQAGGFTDRAMPSFTLTSDSRVQMPPPNPPRWPDGSP